MSQHHHISMSLFNAQCETFSAELLDNVDKIKLTVYVLNSHELIIENLSITDNRT